MKYNSHVTTSYPHMPLNGICRVIKMFNVVLKTVKLNDIRITAPNIENMPSLYPINGNLNAQNIRKFLCTVPYGRALTWTENTGVCKIVPYAVSHASITNTRCSQNQGLLLHKQSPFFKQ